MIGETARTFFALWPDPEVRECLAAAGREIARALAGRATRPENIHMTLVFLGDVEIPRIPELLAFAAEIKADRFSIDFDHLTFRRDMAWAAPRAVPEGLTCLVDNLCAGLKTKQFQLDAHPFAAHVTLVRKARHGSGTQAMEPVCWHANEFAMMRSVQVGGGPRYLFLGRWPLLTSPSIPAHIK